MAYAVQSIYGYAAHSMCLTVLLITALLLGTCSHGVNTQTAELQYLMVTMSHSIHDTRMIPGSTRIRICITLSLTRTYTTVYKVHDTSLSERLKPYTTDYGVQYYLIELYVQFTASQVLARRRTRGRRSVSVILIARDTYRTEALYLIRTRVSWNHTKSHLAVRRI